MKHVLRPKLSVSEAAAILDRAKGHVAVITGAGVSTESGIPDYRGPTGRYTQTTSKPMTHQEFMGHVNNRKRFWSRALIGFKSFEEAHPNRSHKALAKLEERGLIKGVITQNVDRLHHRAGTKEVVELHGRGDTLECMTCGSVKSRREYQQELMEENKLWLSFMDGKKYTLTADGDAIIEDSDLGSFCVLNCDVCSVGILKPAYVFFGGTVPPDVAQKAHELSVTSKAVFVIGTTSSTFSCYRLIRAAHQQGSPVLLVNRGPTRVDDMVAGVFDDASCGEFLEELVECTK